MAASSGSKNPGYCPMDSGNSPLGPAPGNGPAWGRSMFLAPGGLRRWTGQGGAPGAARSPLGVGDPQIAQAAGTGSVWLPPGPSPLVMPAPYRDDP